MTLGTSHCRRLLTATTLSLAVSACAADRVTAPDAGSVGTIRLEATGPATLASLGDTIVVTPRVTTRTGVPRMLDGLPMRLSTTGVVEDLGGGRFRAIGNGQVTIRAAIDTARSGVVPRGYYVDGTADSVVVTVQQLPVGLSIQAVVDTMFNALGETRPLLVRLADARGHALVSNVPTVTFGAADSAVVRVDASGMLRSIRDGVTAVTARAGGLSASRTFTVRATRQHTSCMTYTRRRRVQSSCASVDLVMRYPGSVTP